MTLRRCLLLFLLLLPAAATHATPPLDLKSAAPAVGRDWMDPIDTVDIGDDPDPWPRNDAASAGLDDMIHDERTIIDGAVTRRGVPDHVDQRVFRSIRKVGGDYIVVPLLTFHLDRVRASAAPPAIP